ncbi:unnamed protein product [Xylocopa violacea]|uniref:Condensin complex subunit 2 n=1 Tax=Xylocopa violacea TaxID=135666 RepID=A0ABP1P1Q0_XYLVO
MTRENIASVLVNPSMRTTPISSSPLRRRSVILQNTIASALLENDDEAERLARRHEITNTPVSSTTANDRRRSSLGVGFLMHMSASQITERISQCVKLSTENKINTKNAFSLQMIDFMIYMVKKKDANMTDLQVASTSLDVSTKIYGFRVDGIHMDILKMISAQDKQEKDTKDLKNVEEMDCQVEATNNEHISKKEKKKNRHKQSIFTTVEALKTKVASEKPSLMTMEADLQTTDMLYQATLPSHANSKFYLHPYNDVLVDSVNNKGTQNGDTVYNIPRLKDFSEKEICPPLFYFDFHSWNADDEPSETQSEQNNESKFQFDLDISLSHEDEHVFTTMSQFAIEGTQEENIDRCAAIPNRVENIVDFCDILSNTVQQKVSEYSFVQQNLHTDGAGPSHWKCSSLTKISCNNNTEDEECCHAQRRKRKEIELQYDDEAIRNVDKFLQSQKVKILTKTVRTEWNEELLILPPNMHYDITQANKLYFHRITLKQPEMNHNASSTPLLGGIENCNHINENGTSNHSYNLMNEEHQEDDRNVTTDCATRSEGDMLGTQMPFTGTNLVTAPKLTNKLVIEYSVRAKKIDMRQLKQSIWKCLTSKQGNSNEATLEKSMHQSDKVDGCIYFSNVYRQLPSMLTKINIEALSFPISFVSLLHLANEKTLKISSPLDMTDLIIEQA